MPYGLPDTPFDTLRVTMREDAIDIPAIAIAVRALGVALAMQCERITVERGPYRADFSVDTVVRAAKTSGCPGGEQGFIQMSEHADISRPLWPGADLPPLVSTGS